MPTVPAISVHLASPPHTAATPGESPEAPGAGSAKSAAKHSLVPWLIGVPVAAGLSFAAWKILHRKRRR